MNPSKPTNTSIDIEPSNRRVSFAENLPNEELPTHQLQPVNNTLPLLLQPSYARSKSMIFDELRNFRISLKWCALDHSSCVGKLISYVTFIFFTILVPLLTSIFVEVPSSAPEDDPFSFNKLVQLPESGLAIISFFTISSFFRRYQSKQTPHRVCICAALKYFCINSFTHWVLYYRFKFFRTQHHPFLLFIFLSFSSTSSSSITLSPYLFFSL